MTGPASTREILGRGLTQSGLVIEELWVQCLGMGFNASIERLQAIYDGTEEPTRNDYDLIAQCLNERLKELGVATLVPYRDELGL